MTHRRSTESAPAASEHAGPAYARAILDASLDAVITIDHRGHVLEFNRAAEETFGYRREDVRGRELAELIVPPSMREAHRRALARWSADPPEAGAGRLLGRRIEVEAMRADGSTFPAELTVSRVDVPGPPVFTASLRDVSERRDAESRLGEAEFRYRTLVERLPLLSYVDSPVTPVSSPLYLSPQLESMLGYTAEEWLEQPGVYVRSIHPEDQERVLAERDAAYARGEELRTEYRMVTRDGRTIWVEDRSVPAEHPEEGPHFRQGFVVDITERKQAEEALRWAEARYRSLVEQLPLAVYMDRLDESSSNVYTSPQIEPMLGYSQEEWVSDRDLFVKVLHPDERERVLAAHFRTHTTKEPLAIEYRLVSRDGKVVWVHDEARVIADPEDGEPVLQGYLLDITDRKEAEDRLRHQAFHDSLTGLPNRALFADRVEHALVLHAHAGRGVAVLFLDLDDFKAVNDSLGHAAGDELLRLAAGRLRATLSPAHTVARLGGDEFAVLIEDRDGPAAAIEAAERIVAALQAAFHLDGREVFVSASVGIAVGGSAEELLRSADVAMYRAKGSGKAQYVVYTPRMDEDLVGRLELVSDLRRANVAEEFVLHYQPLVDLRTGAVEGVEALVRWLHPTRGLLPPGEFVPLAEETGGILDLGRWVLAEACRQAATWRSEIPGAEALSVSVNVSTRQVRRPALAEDVRGALAGSGLPPEALTLELTESVLARGRDELSVVLEELAGIGVRLALDDFGTGYSSLSRLQELPVHTLKVDRSFVREIDTSPQRARFVRAIVELAEALDVAVVAEGVETSAQAAALRRLGCRVGQGFHLAPPLEPEAFAALLVSGAGVSSGERRAAHALRPEAA
ncbi:MAG TPA: EAL domain-containing protein [Gaiellaceae bacterium]|nr:EAL domain-containing protein [Gaiellaceae bacterium]